MKSKLPSTRNKALSRKPTMIGLPVPVGSRPPLPQTRTPDDTGRPITGKHAVPKGSPTARTPPPRVYATLNGLSPPVLKGPPPLPIEKLLTPAASKPPPLPPPPLPVERVVTPPARRPPPLPITTSATTNAPEAPQRRDDVVPPVPADSTATAGDERRSEPIFVKPSLAAANVSADEDTISLSAETIPAPPLSASQQVAPSAGESDRNSLTSVERMETETSPARDDEKLPVDVSARARRNRKVALALGGLLCILGGSFVLSRSIFSKPKAVRAGGIAVQAEPRPLPMPAVEATAAAEPPKAAAESKRADPTSANPSDVPWLDGSGGKAPTCDELLGKSGPLQLPAARAVQEMRIAHRNLVQGNVEASQTALCKVSLSQHSNIHNLLELTQVLLIRRDGTAAAEWAHRAIEVNPTNVRAQGLLGDALVRLGKPDEARAAWLAAEGISESDAVAIDALALKDVLEARRALRKGDSARAERFFRRAVSFKPDDARTNAGLAATLLKLGDSRAAEKWASRALLLKQDDPKVQVTMGDVRAALGSKESAEEHHDRRRAEGLAE